MTYVITAKLPKSKSDYEALLKGPMKCHRCHQVCHPEDETEKVKESLCDCFFTGVIKHSFVEEAHRRM